MKKHDANYYGQFWTEVEMKKKKGIRFHVDGKECYADQTAELMQLSEDAAYMQGFTLDSEGNIVEVELNRITAR